MNKNVIVKWGPTVVYNWVFWKIQTNQEMPVAHSCNPSYSGGRDKEDQGSKPAQANSFQTLSWKNTSQRAGRMAQSIGPKFKPQYCKKKKKKK
jgi:hypothetical protein